MDSESQTNDEENNVQNKQEHIKERLKEMGVSQDSVRPEKSWLSKYVNYVIGATVCVLVVAYWYETNRDDVLSAEETADNRMQDNYLQNTNPYYSNPSYPSAAWSQSWGYQQAPQYNDVPAATEQPDNNMDNKAELNMTDNQNVQSQNRPSYNAFQPPEWVRFQNQNRFQYQHPAMNFPEPYRGSNNRFYGSGQNNYNANMNQNQMYARNNMQRGPAEQNRRPQEMTQQQYGYRNNYPSQQQYYNGWQR